MPNDPKARFPEQLVAMLTDFDPDRLTQDVARLGEEWADKNAAASALEETRKSLLAKLIKEQMTPTGGGKPLSYTLAEVRALADERYEAHLEMMVDARREADRARVAYDMGKTKLDLMRSQLATLRQEMLMNRG